MESIIPIIDFHGQEGIQAVSARALYRFLTTEESAHNFGRWAETFITTNEWAIRGEDWVCVQLDAPANGGKSPLDYHLRLDFAKHAAMQAKTQKGQEIRTYFIAIEKRARLAPALNDPAFLRKTLIEYCALVETAQAQIAAQAPLVAYAEKVQGSATSFQVDETAKELGLPVKAFREFVQKKYQFRRGRSILPLEEYGPNGRKWFEIKTRTYDHGGMEMTYHVSCVTGLGRIKLRDAWERSMQLQGVSP